MLLAAWRAMGHADVQPRSVLTGSRAYGTPRPDSDVDLVVLVDRPTQAAMLKLFPPEDYDEAAYADCSGRTIRVGDLNLIMVTTEAELEVWRRGTEALKAEAPVTRARAVQVFESLREGKGVPYARP